MRHVIDHDDTWTPCMGEGLRDVIAEHAITLLADWDEGTPVTRSAGDRRERVTTSAETAGGAQRGD
ncbi:MAG TPA: hypothetical protein VFJ01_05555 [Oleiagrimonas sp.]|nr:hypothetical protein [Oleiagrimonas sp.]